MITQHLCGIARQSNLTRKRIYYIARDFPQITQNFKRNRRACMQVFYVLYGWVIIVENDKTYQVQFCMQCQHSTQNILFSSTVQKSQ